MAARTVVPNARIRNGFEMNAKTWARTALLTFSLDDRPVIRITSIASCSNRELKISAASMTPLSDGMLMSDNTTPMSGRVASIALASVAEDAVKVARPTSGKLAPNNFVIAASSSTASTNKGMSPDADDLASPMVPGGIMVTGPNVLECMYRIEKELLPRRARKYRIADSGVEWNLSTDWDFENLSRQWRAYTRPGM